MTGSMMVGGGTGELTRVLTRAADANASAAAIWDNGQVVTYGELFGAAADLARKIDALVAPNLPLALFLPRSLDSFIGIIAALLSHRAYVPLNPDFPRERILSICKTAGPGALLSCDSTTVAAKEVMASLDRETRLFDMSGSLLAEGGAGEGGLRCLFGDVAYMMFTSGTTGDPKGVCVTQANVAAYLESITPLAGLTPEDRASQFVDHHFDLSVHDIFVGLSGGAELSILPKFRAMEVIQFVRERELTAWCSVPSVVALSDRLGQLEAASLPSLRLAVFCGEALPVRLASAFAKAAPHMRLINMYGPTEATVALTAYEIRDFGDIRDLSIVPLGWPMGRQSWQIGDENNAEGEIVLAGSQVTPGYINAPEQNEEKFFTDVHGIRHYRTGDLGRRSEKFGGLFISRIDDQVKVNGYRIELMEIDAALSAAAQCSQVASIAWPLNADGQAEAIIGFVVGSDLKPEKIRRKLRDLLPSYMVPRKIIQLDDMPVSVNGKIDRKALRALSSTSVTGR